MRNFSFGAMLGTALLALAASPVLAQTQDDFFDDSYVHEIRVVVKASDWDLLRKNFDENTYYPADVHWIFKGKDIPITEVGIRSRGHGSRSPIKPNLRVDLNRYNPGQRFLDLASFILKANNQDPSMLREPIIFKLWSKMGLPASREAYTRLYINDKYWGSYVVEEEIRSPEYTSRYVNDSGGDLYEWKPLSVTEGWADGYHFEWAGSCKTGQLACSTDQAKWNPMPWNPEENKTTFDLAPTINIHRMANQTSDADFDKTMSAVFDLKLFLVHNAIEVWASDFDSFLGDAYGVNNIWIYRFKGTNFHQFFLWDKDGAFSSWNKNTPYLGADRPLFRNAGSDGDSSSSTNVLMKRTLASAARKTEYLEAIYKTAVLAGGAGGWLDWEHQRDYAMAGDSIREDPNKQWSDQGVEKDNNNELWESSVAWNRTYIQYRYKFVMDDLKRLALQYPSATFISQGGVVNAATNLAGPVAPGSVVSIYGSGFSDGVVVSPSPTLWPKTLGGLTVYVNGFEAPIQFVSPGQVNVLVPWEIGMGEGTTPFTVAVNGATAKGTRANSPVNATFTNTVSSSIGQYSPGIYAVADTNGVQGKPSKTGDILVIFANGLGAVSNQPASGAVSPSDKLAECKQYPTVTIGGVPAEVQFAGLAPFFISAYQVNVKVPAGVRAGSAQMVVSAGGQASKGFGITIQ